MFQQIKAHQKAISYVSATLLLVLLILQFTPFWHHGEQGELSASISSYIWFPNDHADLTDYFEQTVRSDYRIEQILLTPIVILIAGISGFLLCLTKPNLPAVKLFPAVCGLIGTWKYMTEPVFHLGFGWQFHFIICSVLLIISALSIISDIKTQQEN